MMPKFSYFWIKTPSKTFFIPARSGSTAIYSSVLEKFYPERLNQWKLSGEIQPHRFMERESIPSNPTAILLRDPVQRFISSCARIKASPQDALNFNIPINEYLYFIPVTEIVKDFTNIKYFKFPDQINDFAEYLELSIPVNIENESEIGTKPVLTNDELSKVQDIFADDIDLFNSLY